MSEKDNLERAERAVVAMRAYRTHVDPNEPVEPVNRTDVVDLLTDLKHWCNVNEVDFITAHCMARTHFDAENDNE